MTELTSYNYRTKTKAFVVVIVAAISSCVLGIYLSRPDAVSSSLRCQYAASVQALVTQVTSAVSPSAESEAATKWKERHQELYDLFIDDQDDQTLSNHFKSLSSAYYTIDALLIDSKAPGLAAAGRAYVQEAERIFTWETSRFKQAEQSHLNFSLILLALVATVTVLLYRVLIVRSFGRMEDVLSGQHELIRTAETQQLQTREFVHQALSGFNNELEMVMKQRTVDLSSELRNRLTKLYRSTHSALAYTRELARDGQRVSVPMSLEGLLSDVAEYIRTQTELNASDMSYKVNSAIRSVTGDADLIGPLLSQACMSVLELPGVRGIAVEVAAVAAEADLVQVSFFISPLAASDADANQQLAGAFTREGKSGDFGITLIDGLVKTIGGKYYLEGTTKRRLCIQLVCERYDDEVSSENNHSLDGRRVFVVDTDIERLRMLVRQLSGYGIQATPFNSQQPVLYNLGILRKFDAGIVVNRENGSTPNELMDVVRQDRALEKLPVIGLYPESDSPGAGVVWDALLTGNYSEAEVVSALRFCLPDAPSNAPGEQSTSPSRPTALQRARR